VREMILVTGAGGFIGGRLCPCLVQAGARVIAADLHFAVPVQGEAWSGDLADPAFVEELFRHRSISAVVHLASVLNTASRLDPALAARINVAASARLIERAARAGVQRFVYASSISAYGTQRAEESAPVAEDSPACPSDVYGASKRFVELAGEAVAARSGLSFVALRIPIVVGPGAASPSSRWRSEIFEALVAVAPREISLPFRSTECIPLCHVDDAAQALRILLEHPRPPHLLYNAPAENVRCVDLAGSVRRQNSHLSCRFGDRSVDGIPAAIDCRRFSDSFGFSVAPIACHLQRSRALQCGSAVR
jgi:nucleoside-diphosphate-sugar epimerase